MLYQFITDIGATDVHFLGHVTNEELTAYELADVFLVRASTKALCPDRRGLHMGVPVLAYAATAVRPRWTAIACSTPQIRFTSQD